MKLKIDGISAEAKVGESLLDIVRRIGLDSNTLKERPLAAAIAGETFTLNYIPVREQEVKSGTRVTLRRAMRASKGVISLLRYSSGTGRRVYERSLLFVFLLAMRELYPGIRVRIEYAIGSGIYAVAFEDGIAVHTDPELIKRRMQEIVEADFPLDRKRMELDDAVALFEADGQTDKVDLLSWRPFPYFDVYYHGDYVDYFYGEMVPSTGYVSRFNILSYEGGIMIMRPDDKNPDQAAEFVPSPRLFGVFSEHEEWSGLMHCRNVAELNEMVINGNIRRLIRVNEVLHERRFGEIADEVINREAQVVLIAGPSSSGKTTSANRLCTQLQVHGKNPVLLSLDDYYIDRDKIEPDENGELDLEHINTIDTDLFRENLAKLLHGEEIEIPRFDFLIQKRVMDGHRIRIEKNTILVIEGLHGLNPLLLPDDESVGKIFKLYVSALTTLNLDDHNRIPTTQLRLLRRMVRDYETRGASVEKTLSMWESVRRGEDRWIFPFQESADAIFNTTLIYEPAVLKPHIFPMLSTVQPESPYYASVRDIVKFLNYFIDMNAEDEIPPTSILREFIGGNTFYR
jgi:uridine kinase